MHWRHRELQMADMRQALAVNWSELSQVQSKSTSLEVSEPQDRRQGDAESNWASESSCHLSEPLKLRLTQTSYGWTPHPSPYPLLNLHSSVFRRRCRRQRAPSQSWELS